MKDMRLWLGLGLLSISSLALAVDLQSHEDPAYLIEQRGSAGMVSCYYRVTPRGSNYSRVFALQMLKGCEPLLPTITANGIHATRAIARMPYTTNRTTALFIDPAPIPPKRNPIKTPATVKNGCNVPGTSHSYNTTEGTITNCRTGKVWSDPELADVLAEKRPLTKLEQRRLKSY